VILQEDPGGQPYLARIRSYLPDNGKLTGLFRFDPARFGDLTLLPTSPFTIDEEGSGVIEITRIVKTAPWFTPTRRYYLEPIPLGHRQPVTEPPREPIGIGS
jgi:hypothetical protein